MKRRTFIIVLGAAGLALASWWLVNFIRDLFISPVSKPDALALILSDKDLRSIGESYRDDFPAEANEDILLEKLLNDNTGELSDRIRKDFESGNVVVINGWVLAVTEARQCALYSIKS